jgi:hypothetical protein
MDWLRKLFHRPRHVAWVPNPTYTLLTVYPFGHSSALQHSVTFPSGFTVTLRLDHLSAN